MGKEEITRITNSTIANPGDVESKRALSPGQALTDKSYASRESQFFKGIKKAPVKI